MSAQNLHIAGSTYDAQTASKLDAAPSAAFAAGSGFVMRKIAELLAYRAFRKAEKQLLELDDRMLKDIGLDRSEIRSALSNARNERLNGARFPDVPGF